MGKTDVIVVGAGFAGIAAARELRRLGDHAVVLEARDRLGGRTWTDHRLGHQLEMGGTWVHWIQPHVWSEVTRYGIEVSQSPTPHRAAWVVGDSLRMGSADELWALLADGMLPLLEQARDWFPLPYQPLSRPDLEQLDNISMASALASLDLDEERAAVAHGMWRTNFNGPIDEAALTQGLRWAALANGNWELMFEACATYRLKAGTRGLIESMAADAAADVRFSSEVVRIEHSNDGCVVMTRDGGCHAARAVIVTLPLNALANVEFEPVLSAPKRAAAAEGQISQGIKVWIRVRGQVEPFVALGNRSTALSLAQYEYSVDGDSLIVGFGPDATRFDGNDVGVVQEALRAFLPDAEVVAIAYHNWVADELTRQTWPMLKTGQLTRYLAEFQRPETEVHLAGSDYASGWAGFIDGAIESGTTVARRVHEGVSVA